MDGVVVLGGVVEDGELVEGEEVVGYVVLVVECYVDVDV